MGLAGAKVVNGAVGLLEEDDIMGVDNGEGVVEYTRAPCHQKVTVLLLQDSEE